MKFVLPEGWAPEGKLDGRKIDLVSELPDLDRMTWPSVEVDIDGIGWSRPFRHGLPDDLSFDDADVELEDQRTDFPTAGDNEPVSLRRSQWPVFDLAYARALKEDHPEIWDAGGSTGEEHSGDSQYAILAPLWARGGAAKTDKEIDAVKTREAWAARHRGNKRLAGVVALIKWLVVGDIGERAMKDVIDEEKEKRQMNLETGPKNVRQHLHEGLQVADEIVRELQNATPDAMGDITGEVKRILAKAGDYAEARTMLEASFPSLDRTQLRNMLTGGMLIAQATGMQTVQQEVDGGRGSK